MNFIKFCLPLYGIIIFLLAYDIFFYLNSKKELIKFIFENDELYYLMSHFVISQNNESMKKLKNKLIEDIEKSFLKNKKYYLNILNNKFEKFAYKYIEEIICSIVNGSYLED